MKALFISCIVAILTLASPCASATLIVDGNGGPGVYITIDNAIAQARSGDIIRVRSGNYLETLSFSGKGLSIIGEGSATTHVYVRYYVTIGPAGPLQNVVLSGMRLTTLYNDYSKIFAFRNLSSSLILNDIEVFSPPTTSTVAHQVRIENCPRVHLNSVSITQTEGSSTGVHPSPLVILNSTVSFTQGSLFSLDPSSISFNLSADPAIIVDGSELFIEGVDVQGGAGFVSWGNLSTPSSAAAAIQVLNAGSLIVAGRSSDNIRGGDGASNQIVGRIVTPGDGAPAIELLGGSTATVYGVTPQGGAAGVGTNTQGNPGPSIFADPTSTYHLRPNALPPIARIVGSPIEGQTITLTLDAESNALAFLIYGDASYYSDLTSGGFGALLILPLGWTPFGPFVVPPSGISFPLFVDPSVPVDERLLFQFIAVDSTGIAASNLAILLVPSR